MALKAMDESQWWGLEEGLRGKGRATLRGGFLCMLHLKEPGCLVGEHMHVRDGDGGFMLEWNFVMEASFLEAMEYSSNSKAEESMKRVILFFFFLAKPMGGSSWSLESGLIEYVSFIFGKYIDGLVLSGNS